ncbi:uncharacterized protein LOC130284884 [Hyla sarda]|uniref:uncharacterized protein LOC130284884 n=1 Tax=Hyla sarda TaxID=327740 RepID=UPI0024C30970|nr:uncharacterized protein LOC130284884 [Hyla sarda]
MNVAPPDMLTLTRQMEDLMIKEMRTWWDHQTLTTYLEKSLVPRGLRLKKRPVKNYSQKCINKWDLALLDCSAKLISYIIEEEESELQTMQKELDTLKESLLPYKNHEEFAKLEQSILKKLDLVESNIMEIKKTKFPRDTEDYNNDQVFSWHLHREAQGDTPKSILRTPRSKSRRRRRPSSRSPRRVSFSETGGPQDVGSSAMNTDSNVNRNMEQSAAPKNRWGQKGDEKPGGPAADIGGKRYALRSLLTPR